ncbi:MAG: hypothetical protein HZC36_07945 [Armatimonadetes bacterium]|nr:hypothetical protein [Armatimonadota bacterium]
MLFLTSAVLLGVSLGHRPAELSPLDANVEFRCAGMPASRALKELGEKCGVSLSASGPAKDLVLVLDFKDVALKEVLPKIAKAASAEWSESKGGFVLNRSSKLLQEQSRKHLELRAKAFAESQEKVRKQLGAGSDFDEGSAKRLGLEIGAFVQNAAQGNPEQNYEGMNALEGKLPAQALAKRLTVLLDPAALALLDNHEVAVYAMNPNRMQRPLPPGARAEIERFSREIALLAAHLPKDPDSRAMMRLGSGVREAYAWRRAGIQTPSTLLCKVFSQEDRRFRVEIILADDSGKRIGSGSVYMAPEQDMPTPPKPGETPAGEKPIELTPEADELVSGIKAAMRREDGAGDFPALSPKLREMILNPEKHELAEAGAGPMLMAAAKAKGVHLAACVPDFLAFLLPMLTAVGFTTPSQLLGNLRGPYMESVAEEQNGWLVIHPVDPVEVEKPFVERALLGRTVRSAVANGSLSLDELADFAVRHKGSPEESALMPHLLFFGSRSASFIGNSNWPFLKLHGLLSAQQKEALFSGKSLRLGELSGPVQTQLARMLYWEQIRSFRSREPQRYDPERFDDPTQTLSHEATLWYPNGLPSGTMLTGTATIGTTIKFRGTQEGGYSTSGDWPPGAVANYLLAKERGDAWASMMDLKSFQAAEKTEVTYEVDAGGPTTYLGNLEVLRTLGNAVDSLEKLPAEVWAQIQQQVKLLRETANNRRIPPRR